MNIISQQLIETFEQLPESEQQQVVAEILRRCLDFDLPPLSDAELTLNAEEIFLNLDYEEAKNE